MFNRMEFLYLGALIAVAAAIQGNALATWLAVAAFALTFIVIRVERPPSSSPPLEERGEEKGESKRPHQQLQHFLKRHGANHMIDLKRKFSFAEPEGTDTDSNENVGQSLHAAVLDVVQKVLITVARQKGTSSAETAYIAALASLGGITPLALIVAKKPANAEELSDEEKMEATSHMFTNEAVAFAGLLAISAQNIRRGGVVSMEFGPHVLWAALDKWQKLYPEVAPDNFLDHKMLESARDFRDNPKLPAHILKGRAEADSEAHKSLN